MAKRKRPRINTPSPSPEFFQEQEAIVKAVHEVARTKHFATRQEAVEFLNQFIGMNLEEVTVAVKRMSAPPAPPSTVDEFFHEAVKSRDPVIARQKLTDLLKTNPNHVRTLCALAALDPSHKKAEAGLRNAIAVGEQNLGSLLQEAHGNLWSVPESHTYLEAKAELGKLLAEKEERREDAISVFQDLLDQNVTDNLGVRDQLLALLLETRRFDEAKALIKNHDTDQAANWLYAKAMLAFEEQAAAAGWDTGKLDDSWLQRQIQSLNKGVIPTLPRQVSKADPKLIKALKFNPWCAIYLLKAHEHFEDEMPMRYVPGSEEEAVLFLQHHTHAWARNPAAMLWLTLTAMPWLIRNGYDDELQP